MFKTRTALALFTVCLFLTTAVTAGAADPKPVPGRVVVSFQPGQKVMVDKSAGAPRTGRPEIDAVLERHGAVSLEPLFGDMIQAFDDPAVREDLARHFVLVATAKAGNDALNADLGALRMVDEAVSDMELPWHGTAFDPNDLSSAQWYLRNTAMGEADIRAVGGWAESLGDSNVVVAVCDSGIDWHHPDLGGPHPDKVNGALWTNWDEYYGTPGLDDDGNGKVDDIRGWDFVNVSSVFPGEDGAPQDNDPMDFGGHGTMVAGCVAPLTDNGIGVAGTAPGCKIMALRIGFVNTSGDGVSYSTIMATAFTYAAANGADIVNLSYGTSYSAAFNSAINAVLASGAVICTSAGNDDTNVAGYLSSWSDQRIVSVAATNSSDGKSDFSNYGVWVDVSAPGSGIYTTAYDWNTASSTYTTTQGTSFSSPIAAGALALIWSANPGMTAHEVVAAMKASCDNIDAENPTYVGELGAGRINLLKALGDNVHQFPQEFPTLYDAFNSSAPGDTIKVLGSETVSGGMLVPDWGVQVYGGYDATYTTRDLVANKTTIAASAGGTGLSFFGTADAATVVDGFAISGGGGQFYANIPFSAKFGGGVVLNGDSPVLRNIEVTGNGVGSSSQLGCGGGVMINGGSPTLENVVIHGNEAVYGGGLYAYQSSPTLIGCEIRDNLLRQDNLTYPPEGGGVYAVDSDLTMIDCTVSGHDLANHGGGLYLRGENSASTLAMSGGAVSTNKAKDAGGGIYIDGGSVDLTRVAFDGNGRTAAATFMHGGGLYATAATVAADSLEFTGNDANVGGGAELLNCPQADVTRSLFAGNAGVFWGGGLAYDGNTAGSIVGNTFTENSANSGGAALYLANSNPAVTHNLSAFNTGGPTFGNGMALVTAPSSLSCNNVFGNDAPDYSGQPDPTGTDGNISLDPLFCNAGTGDYNLTSSSPCTPDNSGGCGLIGALNGGCGAAPVEEPGIPVPVAFRVEQNYPNPFNPATTISFSLPARAHTKVAIFDVAGRLVRTLVDEDLAAERHEVVWTGDDDGGRAVAAGVYFYLVESGQERSVGRMALVK